MTTQLEATAMGPQQIPELHREMSGAISQTAARYALENQVTFDPALQRYSRGLIANDPERYLGMGSDERQVLLHSAMSVSELSTESGTHTTADINANPKIAENGAQYLGPENWRSNARTVKDAATDSSVVHVGLQSQGAEEVSAVTAERPLTLAERARALRPHSGPRPYADGAMDAHVQQFAGVTAAATEKAMANPAAAVQVRRPPTA